MNKTHINKFQKKIIVNYFRVVQITILFGEKWCKLNYCCFKIVQITRCSNMTFYVAQITKFNF